MAETIKIGGELESIATGNVVAAANAIEDKAKGKKQSQINEETDASLADRYTKAETYNKTELNNMITTPNQQYVSVTATSQTTSATDALPATGEADTVYRVGNWDGSQFDASVYSEYAWNGSKYVHLSTKTKIGEIFDISAYHATGGTLATYADLSAALNSNNGGGVPQSLQKGGMSIKFVQSSDNKYVQYRLMVTSFSTTVTDWQDVDEPDLLALFGEYKKVGYFIGQSGQEVYSGRADIAVSPYYPLNGEKLVFSLIVYSEYGKAVSFYDESKTFISGWNPIGEYGKMAISVPVSDIPSGAVYVRVTLADNGAITSGFKTLAQKAENDAQKALEPDLLALFGEYKKVGYFIGGSGEENHSSRTDIAVSPYYPLNGEGLSFSLILYSQYGNAVSFYNEDKVFISGWNPTGDYGKTELNVPISAIPSNAVYTRVTLADNGVITSGFKTLAQKAENDAQKALEHLPAYWLSFLAAKLPLIHTNQENNALNGDSFYFLTDYHIESNAGYSHKIIQYLCEKTTVQNMVYGGDSFNGSTTKEGALEKLREFYYRFYPINMFGLRGNHEFNLNDGGGQSVKLDDNQIFNYLMHKIMNEVVLGFASPMYYYRDVDRLKLRYIYLDARYESNIDPIDDIQIQWMKDRITELESGWSIILFSHQLFNIVSPGEPVVTNPGYNASGTKIINALTSITPDATIVAIIAGHCHYDFSTNEHGFWEISTTCDTRQEYGGLPQTLGTPNEQAFDVFSINLEARTLKAVRIGRGSDRSWSY